MRRNGPRGAGAPDKTWAKVWAKIKEKFPMDREESFRLAAGAILEYCVPEDWGTEASVPDWNVPTVKDLSSLSSSKVGDITSPLIAKLVAQDDTCDLCLEDQTGSIPILFTDPPPPHMHETMLLVRRWRLNISAVKSQSRLYLPYIEAEDWKPISCCLVESPFLERNYVMTVSDFANHITQSGSASTIDCVTAILFVEKECVRWRPFLSQGQEVIISNLANTKMFPKTRRERFILVAHPSTRPHVSIVYQPQHMHSTESEAIISNSSVMASSSASSTMLTTSISPEDPNTAPCLSFAQLHEYTSMWETQQEREIEVVSYCGTITGRQHGFILQLDGSVKVFLQHHWTRGRGLRNGARITLHNTHPIIYNGKFIGFGFCIYGHISVGRFSSSTECFYPIIHSSSRLFPYMEHLSIPDSIWFNESFQSFSSQFPSLSLDELLGSTDMKGHMQEIIRHLGAVQLIRDVYDQFISHHVGGNICATISSGFSKQPPKFVSLCELMKTVETNILAESLSQVITDEDLEQKVWTAGFLVMSADLKSLSLFDNVNRLPAIVPDALPHHLGKLCIVNKFNFICETNPRHIIQFMMADSLHFSHTSVDLPFTHKDDEVPASSSFILLAKNKRLSHNGFSVLGHLIQVDNQGQHEKHNESVTLNFAGRDTGHYVFIKPNNYYSIKGARDVNKSSSSIITIIPPSSIEAASLVSAEDMTPHLCIHETSHKVSLTRMEEASLAAQHTTIHNVRDLLSMAGPDTELFSFRGTLISKALFPSNSLLTIQDVSQPHLISMKIPLSLHPTGLVPGSIVTFFKCTKHIEASLIKMFFNDVITLPSHLLFRLSTSFILAVLCVFVLPIGKFFVL
ncbi:hypothetical protein Pelo_14847 [Pelomyxa schiedti]|nr:hypothetical protein Pelo_14847 [Pelomyxa schiedti]